MRMHIDEVTRFAEAPANGRADAAAAAGDQSANGVFIHGRGHGECSDRRLVASNTTVARPLTRRRASDRQFKFVQRAAVIPGNQGGLADEIGLNVVEPEYMQAARRARRREIRPPGRGCSQRAPASAPCTAIA